MTDQEKITAALEMAKSALSHGAHHKQWTVDQMVRILAGDDYEKWVAETSDGEDGTESYFWDAGIPA